MLKNPEEFYMGNEECVTQRVVEVPATTTYLHLTPVSYRPVLVPCSGLQHYTESGLQTDKRNLKVRSLWFILFGLFLLGLALDLLLIFLSL